MTIIKKAVVCDNPRCDVICYPNDEDPSDWSYVEGILWNKDTPHDVSPSTFHFCSDTCRERAKIFWEKSRLEKFEPTLGTRNW